MKRQILAGPCAQHAMQAAFVMLGETFSLSSLHNVTKTSYFETLRSGTNEKLIAKGIKALGYTPIIYQFKKSSDTRRAIVKELKQGNPCIIAVQDSTHWASILGLTKDNKFVWFDGYDDSIIGAWHWTNIHQWMVSNPKEDDYYFIAIKRKSISIVTQMHKVYTMIRRYGEDWMEALEAVKKGSKERLPKYLSQLYKPT